MNEIETISASIKAECYYCLRGEAKTEFTNKAHVISQFLGKFNPDLYFLGDLVCDECDGELGNTIERIFSRESAEGVIARFHSRARSRRSAVIDVGINDLKIKITCEPATEIDPRLMFVKGLCEHHNPNGLAILEWENGHYAFVILEIAEKATEGSKQFRDIEYKLRRFRGQKVDYEVIGKSDDVIERGIKTLARYGIKGGKRSEIKEPDYMPINLKIEIEQNISIEIARTLSKIAFSYFAYCADKRYRDAIYSNNFKPIREFIRYGRGRANDFVRISNNTGVVSRFQNQQKDFYTVHFFEDNNIVYSRISLLGEIAYQIALGKYPLSVINKEKFGCGHSFSLVSRRADRLHVGCYPVLGKEFDLFCR